MRMQRCPSCGAENSAKRTICYSCEKELAGAPEAGAAAPSRWQALETSKRKPLTRLHGRIHGETAADARGP